MFRYPTLDKTLPHPEAIAPPSPLNLSSFELFERQLVESPTCICGCNGPDNQLQIIFGYQSSNDQSSSDRIRRIKYLNSARKHKYYRKGSDLYAPLLRYQKIKNDKMFEFIPCKLIIFYFFTHSKFRCYFIAEILK